MSFTIEKLKDYEFDEWYQQLDIVCRAKGLRYVLKKEYEDVSIGQEEDQHIGIVMLMIIQSISKQDRALIRDIEHPNLAIKKLKQYHSKCSCSLNCN